MRGNRNGWCVRSRYWVDVNRVRGSDDIIRECPLWKASQNTANIRRRCRCTGNEKQASIKMFHGIRVLGLSSGRRNMNTIVYSNTVVHSGRDDTSRRRRSYTYIYGTYKRACVRLYILKHIITCLHSTVNTCIHAYIYLHTYIHTYVRGICKSTYIHTYIHTNTLTHLQTHVRKYIQT
jgi:hypothetical protein